MENRNEKQLEELVHRELKKLPDLPAPETLVHRVMLSVHERQRRSWWQRSWLNWPLGVQMVSLAILVISAGLVSYLFGAAWNGLNVASISTRLTEWLSTYAPVWEAVRALGGAILMSLQKVGQPVLFAAVGSLLLVYFLCVGLGTVCFRLAFKRL